MMAVLVFDLYGEIVEIVEMVCTKPLAEMDVAVWLCGCVNDWWLCLRERDESPNFKTTNRMKKEKKESTRHAQTHSPRTNKCNFDRKEMCTFMLFPPSMWLVYGTVRMTQKQQKNQIHMRENGITHSANHVME